MFFSSLFKAFPHTTRIMQIIQDDEERKGGKMDGDFLMAAGGFGIIVLFKF